MKNKIVWLLLVVSLVLGLYGTGWCVGVEYWNASQTIPQKVTPSNPLPIGFSNGAGGVSTSVPLQYWSVGAPTSFQGNLSATAPVNLASITSMLPNTFVMLQCTAKTHIGAIGLASATMQFEEYVSAGERIGWRVGTSTFNLQIIADSAAAASYTIKVYPLY